LTTNPYYIVNIFEVIVNISNRERIIGALYCIAFDLELPKRRRLGKASHRNEWVKSGLRPDFTHSFGYMSRARILLDLFSPRKPSSADLKAVS